MRRTPAAPLQVCLERGAQARKKPRVPPHGTKRGLKLRSGSDVLRPRATEARPAQRGSAPAETPRRRNPTRPWAERLRAEGAVRRRRGVTGPRRRQRRRGTAWVSVARQELGGPPARGARDEQQRVGEVAPQEALQKAELAVPCEEDGKPRKSLVQGGSGESLAPHPVRRTIPPAEQIIARAPPPAAQGYGAREAAHYTVVSP